MSYIPENIVSEIRNAADIVDIVSDMVILKKAGKNYQGLCPFHSEKTPSFSVSPEKQMYYCFGCSASGDVFKFLMEYEGLSFPEAARNLARRYGVQVPTQNLTPEEKRRFSEREALFDLNREAMAYFQHMLWKSRAGEPARAYLERRGIKPVVAETFGMGYAPNGWDHLIRSFSKKKIDPALLEKAGLTIPRKSGRGFIDRFRDRIMFPIRDIRRQVVGFGGRVMDEGMPKYLNSPETPVFSKSRTLYGLDTARIEARETKRIYLVEGYFDVISLYQAGVTNSVATLGTALTFEHVRLLKGQVEEVILVFDSDQAGLRAAKRSVEIFRKESLNARILVLPEGHDPDTYMLEFGVDAFHRTSRNAYGVLDFMMGEALKNHGLSIEGKVRIIDEMVEPFIALEDPIVFSHHTRKLAELLGVDEAMIRERMRTASSKKPQTASVQDVKPALRRGRRFKLEQKIVAMILQFPEILPEIVDRDLSKIFEDSTLKALWDALIDRLKEDADRNVTELIHSLEESQRSIAVELAMTDEEWSIEGCRKWIAQFERPSRTRPAEWTRMIAEAQRNDPARVPKLVKEKQQNQARQRHNKT